MRYKQFGMKKEVDALPGYQKLGYLGNGSFGNVYKWKNLTTKQLVAVKVVQIKEESKMDQMKNETNLLSNFSYKNKNIIRYIGSHEKRSQNSLYIFQELCAESLEEFIENQDNEPLEQFQALEIMRQILMGFISLVKFGVSHGDLKPSNILRGFDYNFKISDFGNSRFVGGKKYHSQTFSGTSAYEPPQIVEYHLRGKKEKINFPTFKNDIWAIGVIFYELVSNNRLFKDLSNEELYKRQVEVTSKMNKLVGKFHNKDIRDFIEKCMKFNPKERWDWISLYKHKLFAHQIHTSIEAIFTKKLSITIRIIDETERKFKSVHSFLKRFVANKREKRMKLKEFSNMINFLSPDDYNPDDISYLFMNFKKAKATDLSSIRETELEKNQDYLYLNFAEIEAEMNFVFKKYAGNLNLNINGLRRAESFHKNNPVYISKFESSHTEKDPGIDRQIVKATGPEKQDLTSQHISVFGELGNSVSEGPVKSVSVPDATREEHRLNFDYYMNHPLSKKILCGMSEECEREYEVRESRCRGQKNSSWAQDEEDDSYEEKIMKGFYSFLISATFKPSQIVEVEKQGNFDQMKKTLWEGLMQHHFED